MKPDVSVVVVNYNGEKSLPSNLYSLCNDQLSSTFDILLVDNASQDDSLRIAEEFAAKFPFLRILKSDVNLGYFGGVNYALPLAQGRYLAVLNMDTVVTPGWLCSIVQFLDHNPQAGAVSPLLILKENERKINSAGQNIHVTALGFNRALGKDNTILDKNPIEVSGIHGGAFIIRREILEKIGGFDVNGFLYHEDVDISWLLHILGYDLFCLPEAVVYHDYFLTMYPQKLYLLERNRVAMLAAHLEIWSLVTLAPLCLITEWMMWGYCLLRGPSFMIAKVRSYRWVFQQIRHIQERRRLIRTLRQRSDWQVLKRLSWRYAWDQFMTLGLERGASTRQPTGGIPLNSN